MKKKKEEVKPRKVRIVFEAEENHTNCCECLFGGTCPYVCGFSGKLDCSKLNLSTLELVSIVPVEWRA